MSELLVTWLAHSCGFGVAFRRDTTLLFGRRFPQAHLIMEINRIKNESSFNSYLETIRRRLTHPGGHSLLLLWMMTLRTKREAVSQAPFNSMCRHNVRCAQSSSRSSIQPIVFLSLWIVATTLEAAAEKWLLPKTPTRGIPLKSSFFKPVSVECGSTHTRH